MLTKEGNMKTVKTIGWGILLFILSANPVLAGVFDLGGSYSFEKDSYNAGSYTVTRSYSVTFGYYFTQDSELQFMYQDTTTHDFVQSVQDITYRDRVYSLNLLYYLFQRETPVRPYFRIGVGQLNRDASGHYEGGYSPPGRLDQVSVIGGLGFKVRLSNRFGMSAEAISYLIGGNLSTWEDNITLNIGGSFYF